MSFDQDWCDSLMAAAASATGLATLRLLYIVTETDEGKVAFHLDLVEGAPTAVTSGKLPRGEKAEVTVTAKEAVLTDIWSGARTRDEAFMAADLKIEGAYEKWLDQLVPLFEAEPWSEAWGSGL